MRQIVIAVVAALGVATAIAIAGGPIRPSGIRYVKVGSNGILAGSGTTGNPLTATISVDGTTVTGTGSAGSPLSASSALSGGTDGSLAVWDGSDALTAYAGAGSCPSGDAVTTLNAAGSATCSTFFDTAGTGLSASDNTVTLAMTAKSCTTGQHISAATATGVFTCSADTTYTHPAKTCDAGDVVTAVDSSGNVTCASGIDATEISSTDTGTQNDWAPTGLDASTTQIRVAPTAGLNITGIDATTAAAANGRPLRIVNVGSALVRILDQSSSSATANQICGIASQEVDLDDTTNESALLVYDSTTPCWRVVSAASTRIAHATLWTSSLGSSTIVYGGSTFDTYLHADGIGYGWNTNSAVTGWINQVGYRNGTTQPRSLNVGDGQGSASTNVIASFDASDHSVTIPNGPLTVDHDFTAGTSWSDKATLKGEPVCSGTTPTLTGFGGSATVDGTSCSGIIHSSGGTTGTLTWATAWTHTPPCTFTMASGTSTAAVYITSQSTSATAITYPNLAGTAEDINYQCGFGY